MEKRQICSARSRCRLYRGSRCVRNFYHEKHAVAEWIKRWLGAAQQIVGPEPRAACFASSVIRLSCSVAPWPGQLNRCALINMRRPIIYYFAGVLTVVLVLGGLRACELNLNNLFRFTGGGGD